MKKTLYIHIGTGKTGTTAIQSFFDLNKIGLMKQGFKYIDSGRVGINHHLLCRNCLRSEEKHEKVSDSLRSLRSEILTGNEHSYFISSENFPGNTEQEVKELADILSGVCSVKVIVYLRRQDTYAESWYLQIVKADNYSGSFESLVGSLIKKGLLDYKKLINIWTSVFGNENVIARPYEKNKFLKGDLIYDIAGLIGLVVQSDFVFYHGDPNPSLSKEQIQLANELIKIGGDSIIYIVRKPIYSINSSKSLFSTVNRNKLLDESEATNSYLTENFGNGDDFFDTRIDLIEQGVFDSNEFRYSWFVRDFVVNMLVEGGEKLDRLSDPLVKYLHTKFDQLSGIDMQQAIDYLILAKLIRPDGPSINAKLKVYIRNKLLDESEATNSYLTENFGNGDDFFDTRIDLIEQGVFDSNEFRYSWFVRDFVVNMLVEGGEKLDRLSDPLVKYLHTKFDQLSGIDMQQAIDYLILAKLIRPDGPSINAKLKVYIQG